MTWLRHVQAHGPMAYVLLVMVLPKRKRRIRLSPYNFVGFQKSTRILDTLRRQRHPLTTKNNFTTPIVLWARYTPPFRAPLLIRPYYTSPHQDIILELSDAMSASIPHPVPRLFLRSTPFSISGTDHTRRSQHRWLWCLRSMAMLLVHRRGLQWTQDQTILEYSALLTLPKGPLLTSGAGQAPQGVLLDTPPLKGTMSSS